LYRFGIICLGIFIVLIHHSSLAATLTIYQITVCSFLNSQPIQPYIRTHALIQKPIFKPNFFKYLISNSFNSKQKSIASSRLSNIKTISSATYLLIAHVLYLTINSSATL